MNLKKSDKMIAGIAVLVLIIAAVGIVLYTEEKQDKDELTEDKEFAVQWVHEVGSMTIEGSVGKTSYTEPFIITAPKSDAVITNVNVHISWTDDKMFGILRSIGADTIKTIIGLSGGESQEYQDKGMGNETFSFNVFTKPNDKDIEDVEDIAEAEIIISEEYSNMDSADFNVEVSWIGRKITNHTH